ncbi:MAG: DEAD/DEAH box helicase [Candidatus Krumholzibacteriia bacterium]
MAFTFDHPTEKATGFDRFGLDQALVRGIRDAGFITPRPIQAETIPAGLAGRDVLGLAQTGTGKTAAFALPLLDRLLHDRRRAIRALVLAPTRELATQIAAEIRLLARHTPIRVAVIFGGVAQSRQVSDLRNRPEIVVGCPGRVLDLIGQNLLHLDEVETLVLDEADHMFDMGFLPPIRKIIRELPRQRQNLLFSATMPREIRGLADDLLRQPHVVELAGTGPAATIDHGLVLVAEQRKRDLLEHLLRRDDCDSAIVFTRTKHRAKRLADQLSRAGLRAVGLQGNLSQAQRDRAMNGFRTRQFNILVATDIVARGIDVSGVSHVINFDVPNTPEAYTHRIGRTGRAELEGTACTFVTSEDHEWLRATERMIGSPIRRQTFDGFATEREPVGVLRAPARGRQAGGQARSQDGGQTASQQLGQPASQSVDQPRGRQQRYGRGTLGSRARDRRRA